MKFLQNLKVAIFIAFTIVLFACKEEVNMDIDFGKNKIILNTILQPDSFIKISLTRSIPVTSDSDFSEVRNAFITLMENGAVLDTLTYEGNSFYTSKIKPKHLNVYAVKVLVNDTLITAVDTIPDEVKIDSFYILSKNIDNYSIRMVATEIENENNYYLMRILEVIEDSVSTEKVPKYSLFTNLPGMLMVDYSLIFDDSMVKNKQVTIDFHCPLPNAKAIKIELYSLSLALYYYYITATQNYYANFDSEYKRVPMYSNVSNKVGIMGSQSYSVAKILLK